MPDEQVGGAQAATVTTTPQAGDNGAAQTQAAGTATGQAPAAVQTVAELQAQIERERAERQAANKEAQQMRAKLKQLEDAEAKRAEATLSEQEKAVKRAEAAEARAQELETRVRETTIRSAVQAAAVAAGVIDPDAAYKLLDVGKIELDKDGGVTNAQALVAGLVAAKPYLLGTSGASSATNTTKGGASAGGRDAELRQMLRGGMEGGVFDADRLRAAGGGVVMPLG